MAKAKKKAVKVPQTLEEAAIFVADLGEAQRAVTRIETNLNSRVEQLTTEAVEKAAPHRERYQTLLDGLFAFAQSRYDELTDGGKVKTVDLTTGTLSWRFTPPAVKITGVEAVIARLKELRLFRFIRRKEEVDREAMLADPDRAETVQGVRIGRDEIFIVKPANIDVEIPAGKMKAKTEKKTR